MFFSHFLNICLFFHMVHSVVISMLKNSFLRMKVPSIYILIHLLTTYVWLFIGFQLVLIVSTKTEISIHSLQNPICSKFICKYLHLIWRHISLIKRCCMSRGLFVTSLLFLLHLLKRFFSGSSHVLALSRGCVTSPDVMTQPLDNRTWTTETLPRCWHSWLRLRSVELLPLVTERNINPALLTVHDKNALSV